VGSEAGTADESEVSPETVETVFEALRNPKFRWRTIAGISGETQLDSATVWRVLAREIGKTVVVAPAPSTDGATLFATREHVLRTASLGQRLAGAIKNRLL
jgi:predicted flavoprotein YhiN